MERIYFCPIKHSYIMLDYPCFRISAILVFLAISASMAGQGRQRVGMYYSEGYMSAEVTVVYDADMVDEVPVFPGGERAMLKFINSERSYPEQAYNNGISGRVLCGFIIGPDGTISHIQVLRGVEESLDREAVRVISKMPKWVAGRINNSPVPVHYILPIPFRL